MPADEPSQPPAAHVPGVEQDRLAQPVDAEQPPRLPFPVVGVGASAGGIEAFGEFLDAMRPDSGMAFVFILHLSPDQKSLLPEILGGRTAMPVAEVEDGMPVEPNRVYVICPGHVLTVRDGALRLGPKLGGPRAADRPVDDFFRSLAEEQRERAICVVMSGMGSNGTAGAQAVKAVGGLCVAQDPESAGFPSMPRHLVDAGYADYIARPGDLPDILLTYAGSPYARGGREADAAAVLEREHQHLREILAVLRTRTKQDFTGYKKPTLLRRVQRRMGLTRTPNLAEYARLLRQTPGEVSALADDLLIHVTGFFRDPEAWEALRERVIVPLVEAREAGGPVRAWVTACSSGEEAYSLAMLLTEESERAGKRLDIKVFATDLAERTLAHARAGVYPGGIESEIPPERLVRFFAREDEVYRVRQDLRDRVVFAPQNILQDPPFSRLDIASCRNLLIYLEPEIQQRVLSLLHFGLREGGTLFLGTSETVTGAEELFEPLDRKARIYRRVGPTRHGMLDFPIPRPLAPVGQPAAPAVAVPAPIPRRPAGRAALAELTRQALLEHHTPPAVTVDRDGQIMYYHGDTRPFLQQLSGEPTRDLMLLARDGVRGAIRVVLHRAAEENRREAADGWVELGADRRCRVRVTASPVADAAPDRAGPADYYVVGFEERGEIAPPALPAAAGGEGAEELRRLRGELQSTIEELQTSNEELKASNEEVMSINEELQSSNEELETSKEELQSLNEELRTVNAQLRAKMEEHQATSSDLSSLLTSTDIAVLFLDPALRIRRFTPAVRDLLDLIPTDVGRPLAALARKFDDPALDDDCRAVLERLVPVAREVSAASGRHYLRRVLPYSTVDNRIDGAVVTFVDVTERKDAERALAEEKEYAESIVETLHEPVLVLHPDLTVKGVNPAFYTHFRVDPADTVGRKVYELGNGQWNIPALRTLLEDVLPDSNVFNDYEVTHEFESLGRRVMLVNGRRLDHVQLILLGIRDITERAAAEAALRASEERHRALIERMADAHCVLDREFRITRVNAATERVLGVPRAALLGRSHWDVFPASVDAPVGRAFKRVVADGVEQHLVHHYTGEGYDMHIELDAYPTDEGGVAMFWRDVTDRVRAEAALRESEGRLRAVASNLPNAAVFVVGPDLRYALAEGEGLRATGLAPADLEGKTVREAVGAELADEYEPRYRGALAGVPFRVEHAAHGQHFVSHGVPLRDAAGAVTAALAVSYDITDRVRAEAALRAGEERLRLALAAGNLGTWDWDVRTGAVVWNDEHFAMQGYAPGEVPPSYEAWLARVHPDDRAGAAEAVRAAQQNRTPYRHDYRALHPDGTVRWVETLGSFFYDEGGAAVRMVGVARDATERRAAETALRESEERLRLALAAARMGTWAWDVAADRHHRDANLNALLGLPAAETTEPLAGLLARVHPDDRGAVSAAFDQTVRHGRPLNVEFRVLWPDGAVRWLRDQGDVFGTAGRVRMLGACADVTDLKEAEAALQRANDELEERVRARTVELAAALDSLQAEMVRRADLARRLSTAQEDERKRVARDLHDSVGQLLAGLALAFKAVEGAALPASVAAKLADAQRVADALGKEVHALAVRLRPTSLDDIGLEAALAQLVREWCDRTGVKAEFHASGIETHRLPADVETTVYRAVQEALTNVARHAGATAVGVVVRRPDGFVSVVVEDNGVGFEPTAATDRLGLVGMRERVGSAGGELEIESRPGAGTSIIITIPVPTGEKT